MKLKSFNFLAPKSLAKLRYHLNVAFFFFFLLFCFLIFSFILTLRQYPFFLWMSPHVPVNKECTWALLVARNLSMLPQQFCPSTLPASDMTEEVKHTSSFLGYPFEPLEEETQTRKQSRKAILEPRGQCMRFTSQWWAPGSWDVGQPFPCQPVMRPAEPWPLRAPLLRQTHSHQTLLMQPVWHESSNLRTNLLKSSCYSLYNKWGWTVHMIAYTFRIYLVSPWWPSSPDTREDFMSIPAGVLLLMRLCMLFSLQREQTPSPWLSIHADYHGCIVLQKEHSLPFGICPLQVHPSEWYLRVISFYFVTCQISPPMSTTVTVNGALVYPLASYVIAFIPVIFSASSWATQVFIERCPFATKNVHSGHVPHGMGTALWLKACRVQGYWWLWTCLARVHGKFVVYSLNGHAHMEWWTTVM